MESNFEACPYCGKKIMKGAMRCASCGKMLKTADQQQASIKKYKEAQQSSFFSKLIKFFTLIIILIAVAMIYKKYGNDIMAYIKPFLGK